MTTKDKNDMLRLAGLLKEDAEFEAKAVLNSNGVEEDVIYDADYHSRLAAVLERKVRNLMQTVERFSNGAYDEPEVALHLSHIQEVASNIVAIARNEEQLYSASIRSGHLKVK